jgi:hypothetical protein
MGALSYVKTRSLSRLGHEVFPIRLVSDWLSGCLDSHRSVRWAQ